MTIALRLLLLTAAAVAATLVAAAWAVASSLPPGVPLPLARLLAAGAVVLLLATWVALRTGRRVADSAAALAAAAHNLGQDEEVAFRTTGLPELDGVAQALSRTGESWRTDRDREAAEVEAALEAASRGAPGGLPPFSPPLQRTQALGRVTGAVAHDFNNVLGVISNSLLLLRRLPSVDAHKMPIGAIERATANGTRLTRHLQRLAGRTAAPPGFVELGAWLDEAADLLKTVLGSSVKLVVAADPGTPRVRVDAGELELALINLALNARDALPAGGTLTLHAGIAAPEDVDGPGTWAALHVIDSGPGITEDVRQRAFLPGYTTRPEQRAGLGLAQVQAFCREAGGDARIGTGPGGTGTEVLMLLPSAENRAAMAAAGGGMTRSMAGTGAGQGGGAGPGAGAGLEGQADVDAYGPPLGSQRLLLVEDNESLGEVTEALLRSHGYDVVRAPNARDALARVAEPGAAFDVVLSDVVMPGEMDGVAMARQLRRDHPHLPIVLISGYSAALSSADEFEMLYKPYAPHDLVRLLRQVVAAES